MIYKEIFNEFYRESVIMRYLKFIGLIIASIMLVSCGSSGGGGADVSSGTSTITIAIGGSGKASIIEQKEDTLFAKLKDFVDILSPAEVVAGTISPSCDFPAIPDLEVYRILIRIAGDGIPSGSPITEEIMLLTPDDHCDSVIRTFTVPNGNKIFSAIAEDLSGRKLYTGSTPKTINGADYVRINMEAAGGCSFYELTEVDPLWNGSPDNSDDGIDDGFIAHTMPWPFAFYGRTYTQASIDYNGSIWFEFEGSDHSFDLATGGGHGPVISAWNNNLSTVKYGRVRVRDLTSPDRVVIGWYAVETYECYKCDWGASFEVVLYPDGNIQFNYEHFDSAYARGSSGSADSGSGISKGDGQSFESLTDEFGPVYSLLMDYPGGRSFMANCSDEPPVDDGCDLYADVINGSDEADCRTADTACETITHALTLTDGNETICVAAGFYDDEDGWERFPLQLKAGTRLLCQGAAHSSIINSFDRYTDIIGASGASVEGCRIQEGAPAIDDGEYEMSIINNIIENTCLGISLYANSTVSSNVFQNMSSSECNNVAIRVAGDGALIDSNTLVNIGRGMDGIRVKANNTTITNNEITGNSDGIHITSSTSGTVINNNILSCNRADIDTGNFPSGSIDVRNNRWDNVPPEESTSFFDGVDILYSGTVNFLTDGAALAPSPCNPLTISPTSASVSDIEESVTFTASGGVMPYSWSAPGAWGYISPSNATQAIWRDNGSYCEENDSTVTVTVTDSNGDTATADLTIFMRGC